jgi:hypothetical protein
MHISSFNKHLYSIGGIDITIHKLETAYSREMAWKSHSQYTEELRLEPRFSVFNSGSLLPRSE